MLLQSGSRLAQASPAGAQFNRTAPRLILYRSYTERTHRACNVRLRAGDLDSPESISGTQLTTQPPPRRRQDNPAADPSSRPLLQRTWQLMLYNYYSVIRQDTFSDLQIIVAANVAFVLLASVVKRLLVDQQPQWWQDLYEAALFTAGQNWAPVRGAVPAQIYSLLTYTFGLIGFALVLALMEQAVLQVLEERVRQGSAVLERGHVVILGWCESQMDLKTIETVVQQMCAAHSSTGGTVIVVLTQREKLEMEAIFRAAIPPERRRGSRLMFRQGSPLALADLQLVAAAEAGCIVVVSDSSKTPDEADSQSLRTTILLDELEEQRRAAGGKLSKPGHVVVDVRTAEAVRLMRFSERRTVVPMPSTWFNARRLANMVQRPVVAEITDELWDFENAHQLYIHQYPQLYRLPFGELAFYFPDAIVVGIVERPTGYALLNPPCDYRLCPDEDLLLVRPNSLAHETYQPLATPVSEVLDSGWQPPDPRTLDVLTMPVVAEQVLGSDSDFDVDPATSFDIQELSASSMYRTAGQCSMLYAMPQELLASNDGRPIKVLVCGWGEDGFMHDLLASLDTGITALPLGSMVTFLNPHDPSITLQATLKSLALQRIGVCHVTANPLRHTELAKIDIGSFRCAIVLADFAWSHSDSTSTASSQQVHDGNQMDVERDVLRVDSLTLRVQLNIRLLMSDSNASINIICQQQATRADTRFEDPRRLPLGISFNLCTYSARLLSQVAYNPRIILPRTVNGLDVEPRVVNADAYCAPSERLTFWQLARRAQACSHILLGYYELPLSASDPVETVICPKGNELRGKRRIWNTGTNRLKFIILKDREDAPGEFADEFSGMLPGSQLRGQRRLSTSPAEVDFVQFGLTVGEQMSMSPLSNGKM